MENLENTNNSSDESGDLERCLERKYWYYFLCSSFAVLLGGLSVILLYRLLALAVRRIRNDNSADFHNEKRQSPSRERHRNSKKRLKYYFVNLQLKCEELLSGQSNVGIVMVCVYAIFNITSIVLYFIIAFGETVSIESCRPWKERVEDRIDFAVNIFFLLHFLLRLFTACDKLKFWFELNSLIDFATIPPALLEVCLNRQWLGLKFMRCFRLINIPDILQYLKVLKSGNVIRVAQLIAIFFSVWFSSAGFIQLLENSGDNRYDDQLTYFDCLYYVIITLSTVGYGDFSCRTIPGKIFIVVFIIVGLGIFAGLIPELIELVGRHRQKYKYTYKKEAGTKHIIVGGHITYGSVKNFIYDFHHGDRSNHKLRSIFVSTEPPSLELEALIKRNYTKVSFVRASLMNVTDLLKINLSEAQGCLIIANQKHEDPNEEDAGNIMRAISVKNSCPDCKIILQLINFKSKVFCLNLPFWTEYDQVICISEMKLGIMATSSLVPGFSTLMSNLITMISYKHSDKRPDWMNDYLRGAGHEIYLGNFSPHFYGLKFPEAVEICYSRLGLTLLGVYSMQGKSKKRLSLNPGPDFTIDRTSKGFFICQSEEEALYAQYYCPRCHETRVPKKPKPCSCKGYIFQVEAFDPNNNEESCKDKELLHERKQSAKLSRLGEEDSSETDDCQFESTGLLYWCQHRGIAQSLITAEKAASLKDHIILCCVDEKDASLGGLTNFVMPLRASSIPYQQLKTVVLLVEGINSHLKKAWSLIGHFPDVYILVGSCLDRHYLRMLKVERCSMCVILTSSSTMASDHPLIDKESILCHLIIKTMTFESTINRMAAGSYKNVENLIRTISQIGSDDGEEGNKTTKFIPTLTELADEYNIQFLEQDDVDDPSAELYMTQPFVCGSSFVSKVLDQFMSTVYFAPQVFILIRTLVSGGDTQELEQGLAEGFGLQQCQMSKHKLNKKRNRNRISMLHLDKPPLNQYASLDFGQLFLSALKYHNILCLGLYRKMTFYFKHVMSVSEMMIGNSPHDGPDYDQRVVITNPPAHFSLIDSDMVYCLQPFDSKSRPDAFAAKPELHV